METAKETVHKITHSTKDSSHGASGLERDLEPKPTKVHLPSGKGNETSPYVPSGKLQGKKALITGGDSGIGRSIAILFAMEGAMIAIAYRTDEEEDAQHTKAQIEKNGGQVLLLPCDLTHPVNCKDVADRTATSLGGIDVLVNNAATRREQHNLGDISDEQWSETIRTNVDSYFYVTKYVLPHLSSDGVIINSASVDSYIGTPSSFDYTTSKGAVIAFTQSLSNKLIKEGIRVNAVAAGPVWTPLMATTVGDKGKQGHGLGNKTPMGRLGQPVEIATSYVFLASKDSAFMSGQVLHPNGGLIVHG